MIVFTCVMFGRFARINMAKVEVEHTVGKFGATLVLHSNIGIFYRSLLFMEMASIHCELPLL